MAVSKEQLQKNQLLKKHRQVVVLQKPVCEPTKKLQQLVVEQKVQEVRGSLVHPGVANPVDVKA
jgi:hypothetical protein